MKHGKLFLAALAAAVAIAPAVLAQGDSASGATVARTWCSNCHAVAGGRSALDAAPPFDTVANERTNSEIKAFLARPHGLMPNIQLSRQQVEDVIAYMNTLR